MTKLLAKFSVESVSNKAGGSQETHLKAVTTGSEENKSFSLYTPDGNLWLTITNEAAKDFFVPGKEYKIEIYPAESEAANAHS